MKERILHIFAARNLHTLAIGGTLCLWLMITLYWIVTSRRTSDCHQGGELFSFIKLIGSSLILYLPLLTGGWMEASLFRPSPVTDFIGLALCVLGTGLMAWARHLLGRNWSGKVVLQNGHTLTRGGPYRFVRHPIYAGGLCAMLGSALVVGEIFSLLWVLFCAYGLLRKAIQEEDLLSARFPAEYGLYKQQTRRWIPFLW